MYLNWQIGETCSSPSNSCDAGLTCGACPANANTRPRCTRIHPIIPTTKVHIQLWSSFFYFQLLVFFFFLFGFYDFGCWEQVKGGLAFNQYSWLTTHNSYARAGSTSATGSTLLSPTNQEDSVTNQLNVRTYVRNIYIYIASKRSIPLHLLLLSCNSLWITKFFI